MQQNTPTQSLVDLLARLDAIVRELQALRRLILGSTPQPTDNFTDMLLGSLGSESLTDYDYNLDLERFSV